MRRPSLKYCRWLVVDWILIHFRNLPQSCYYHFLYHLEKGWRKLLRRPEPYTPPLIDEAYIWSEARKSSNAKPPV